MSILYFLFVSGGPLGVRLNNNIQNHPCLSVDLKEKGNFINVEKEKLNIEYSLFTFPLSILCQKFREELFNR